MAISPARKSSRGTRVLIALIGAVPLILVGYWQWHRPPEQKAALAGRVVGRNQPDGIEGATLILTLPKEAPQTKKSRQQGTFLFSNLSATTGTLTISADGYGTRSFDVTPSGDPQVLEYVLTANAEPPPSPQSTKPAVPTQADPGHARAEANLGWWHETGQVGGKKDYDAAMRWYVKAVEDGDALANWNIGRLYEFGYGVSKDIVTAKTWYQKAADHGVLEAQDSLANLGHNPDDASFEKRGP